MWAVDHPGSPPARDHRIVFRSKDTKSDRFGKLVSSPCHCTFGLWALLHGNIYVVLTEITAIRHDRYFDRKLHRPRVLKLASGTFTSRAVIRAAAPQALQADVGGRSSDTGIGQLGWTRVRRSHPRAITHVSKPHKHWNGSRPPTEWTRLSSSRGHTPTVSFVTDPQINLADEQFEQTRLSLPNHKPFPAKGRVVNQFGREMSKPKPVCEFGAKNVPRNFLELPHVS